MMVQKGTGTVNVIGDNTNGKLAVGNNNSVNEIVAAKDTDLPILPRNSSYNYDSTVSE